MSAGVGPALIHLRHGETDWNREGRLQGQEDIPLNDLGRRQAARSGETLRRHLPDLDALPWFVSPMERARETARLARRAAGLDPAGVTIVDDLRELSFGRWQGLRWHEVQAFDPAGAAARDRDKWHTVPPGGESYAMMAERIAACLATLPPRAVLVGHGGVARCLLVLRAGVAPAVAADLDIWQDRPLAVAASGARWLHPGGDVTPV